MILRTAYTITIELFHLFLHHTNYSVFDSRSIFFLFWALFEQLSFIGITCDNQRNWNVLYLLFVPSTVELLVEYYIYLTVVLNSTLFLGAPTKFCSTWPRLAQVTKGVSRDATTQHLYAVHPTNL